MNYLIYLKIQMSIFARYLNIVLTGSIIQLLLIAISLSLIDIISLINIPLIIIIINVFIIGPLFFDIFSDNQSEKIVYYLRPWCLRAIIISKNITLLVYAVLFSLPLLITSAFFFDHSYSDYLNAFLYFVTCLSQFMVIGNLISFMPSKLNPRAKYSHGIIFQYLMIALVSIPYLILNTWLQSITACLLFTLLLILIWYFYLLPTFTNKFISRFTY